MALKLHLIASRKEKKMAIHKVIEVISESEKGWEDAARKAVADAERTVRNIKSIYIGDMKGMVENSKIVAYRVIAKITFEVEPGDL